MCGLVCRVPHVNIRMSLTVGSIPTPPTWHGVWLRLIENTTTARGRQASEHNAGRQAGRQVGAPEQPLNLQPTHAGPHRGGEYPRRSALAAAPQLPTGRGPGSQRGEGAGGNSPTRGPASGDRKVNPTQAPAAGQAHRCGVVVVVVVACWTCSPWKVSSSEAGGRV